MHLDRKFPIPGHNIEVRVYFVKTNRYRTLIRYHRENGSGNIRVHKLPEVYRAFVVAKHAALKFVRENPNPAKLIAGSMRGIETCYVAMFEHQRLRRAERDVNMFDKFFMNGVRASCWPHQLCIERYAPNPSMLDVLREYDREEVEADDLLEPVEE